MKPIYSDEVITKHIKAGGQKRQKAIALIYRDKKLKNQVVAFVRNNNGSNQEGIDIFHEGIIAFDENVRKDKYQGKGALKGYLFSICRFLWLNRLKREQRMVYTAENKDLDQVSYETPEHLSLKEEQKKIIDQLLSQLGDKCQKILELWKLSYSMQEIADEVGLQDAGIARRQRYSCYQKFLQVIDKKPNLKNVLKLS
ncbi:MAG: sigma-70 family RNA polymerase sigma factor [Bacteroidota bacterium]